MMKEYHNYNNKLENNKNKLSREKQKHNLNFFKYFWD